MLLIYVTSNLERTLGIFQTNLFLIWTYLSDWAAYILKWLDNLILHLNHLSYTLPLFIISIGDFYVDWFPNTPLNCNRMVITWKLFNISPICCDPQFNLAPMPCWSSGQDLTPHQGRGLSLSYVRLICLILG